MPARPSERDGPLDARLPLENRGAAGPDRARSRGTIPDQQDAADFVFVAELQMQNAGTVKHCTTTRPVRVVIGGHG